MAKISVYIITYNEVEKLKPAIASVIDWVDEVIVADSLSSDDTVKVAMDMGAKVVQIPFNGFGDLRNQAITHCQYEWIFSLDTDERCTVEAQREILAICADNQRQAAAYLMPRRNYLLGRWIKHSGWYPDYRQPQLFRKGKMHYTKEPVHEGYRVDGEIAKLTQAIWQFPFENMAQMLHKANRYSTLNAEKLLAKGVKGGIFKGLWHGAAIFWRNYIFRGGFLDGRAGFMIALGNFISTFYKYAKLLELQKQWCTPDFCDIETNRKH
ncbi:MAG: glycosyltransferase family 2 protein [Gammaproteobacteria bacterium]|nr:glycosyltransferase family 2 protein [Gammaproteobacteria bacterium]